MGQLHIQKAAESQRGLLKVVVNQYQQDGNFQNAFKSLDDAAQGKQPFKALKGVDPAEFRLDGLAGHQHLGLEECDAHGQQGGDRQKGAGHDHKAQDHLLQQLLEHAGSYSGHTAGRVGKAEVQQALDLLQKKAAHNLDHKQAADQGSHSHGILAHQDITFFSFVPSLFWCCLFGLGVAGHGVIPPLSAAFTQVSPT